MQDHYVGDIGDYGKYGLLRCVADAGLRLAVNWYRVIPTRPGKQEDGKFTTYLHNPDVYRQYDPKLFDCLSYLVKDSRSIEAVEKSGILNAHFFTQPLTVSGREQWHKAAMKPLTGQISYFLIRITASKQQRCTRMVPLRKNMSPGKNSRTIITGDKA